MITGSETTTLEGLSAEMEKIRAGKEYPEVADMLKSKLALVVYALLHLVDQKGEEESSGIEYLIHEIKEGISNMGDFCLMAQDYLTYSNNPDRLAKTQELEEMVASWK